jgi:hypothetical protein
MRRLPRGFWPLLALALATIPVANVFTLSKVFFIRDLSLAFRSRFLFLRHSVLETGTFPLWDPYPAHGQAAAADALYQLFHLPSLPLRLLLPEIVAYNAWIALPVPVGAAGMFLFLRRRVGPRAACFGAVAFAASGPIVSTTNFPNMSWSVVAVPYVFWTLERLIAHRSAAAATALAVAVACQALAGEPVTLAATLAIAAAYAVLPNVRWRDVRLAAVVALAMTAGMLLAAIQYVPLAIAARSSVRGAIVTSDFWAFHPLALIELLVPHFFGDYFNSNLRELVWMLALNSQRDPFYYTMYVGVPIAVLAGVAMLSGRPGTRFWTVVIAACAIASLGPNTPLYPWLQELVPIVKSFRFPVKYLSLAAFGLATLAAIALQWLIDRDAPPRAVRIVLVATVAFAAVAYLAIAWILLAPGGPIRAVFHLAVWAHVPQPIQGAEFVLFRARPLLTSLLLKLLCTAFLLWLAASARRERRLGVAVLAAVATFDLLASNSSVNPTTDPALLDHPEWSRHIPADMHERVYVGGRLEGYVNTTDVDAPKYARYLDEYTELEQRYVIVGQFMFHTSGHRIRESMSYDLPLLWPREFSQAGGLFKLAPREDRLRFLERAGVRFMLLPTPPYPGAVPLARMVAVEQLQLYDANPGARRVYVVPDALLGADVTWQIHGLFQPRFDPSAGVLVSEPPPPPSGVPGPPAPPSAVFVEDGLHRVVVRAGTPGDGYLALLDSYDPDWRVDVDGQPAPLMRANGLFRAVRLTPGQHTVTFTYRPSTFYLGAGTTAATAVLLAAWCAWGRRARRSR